MASRSRRHWSYSALSQYLRCPLQYYFERVLKLSRETVGSGLVMGSAVHEALATYHRTLQRNNDVDPHEIQQSFLETWIDREDQQRVDYKPTESRNDLIAQGIALLELYLKEPPPEKILLIEHRILVPLVNSDGDILETPLYAITDLVVREEGILKVQEFKTSGRSYGEFEVENSLQATCYVHALKEEWEDWASVEYVLLVKTKSPKIQRLKTSRHEMDLGRLGDLVETIESSIQQEIFYPVESQLNCSMCSYRKQCREWKPKRALAEVEFLSEELEGVSACS